MKRIIAYALLLLFIAACVNDDNYSWEDDFADKTATDTIKIGLEYSGTNVAVTGDDYGFVSAEGAHVTVKSGTNKFLQLTLSGSTTDGSLLIYSWRKLGVVLDNVSITNPDGPAINNQCGKSLYVTLSDGSTNTLTDGLDYLTVINAKGDTIDQKATLFSEGQIYFGGNGMLTVNGNTKNGIASDDYIVVNGGAIHVNVSETGTNGVKVNDGFSINDGTLTITVLANGSRGIKCDAKVEILGGETTITTMGDCLIETVNGVADTTTCAGIKCDSLLTMTAGMLAITSTGDGGKGINCADTIRFMDGTLVVNTTGGNREGKPKAVKGNKGIIVSGGSLTASCQKSWALDNGVDTEDPMQRVTIVGAPTTKDIQRRSVVIKYE